MGLLETEFLFLDCQTTGMRPSTGRLLEISWAWARANDPRDSLPIESRLIALPEGEKIPIRVQDITGITEGDLSGASTPDKVRAEFLAALARPSSEATAALIHHAQFEQPFLVDFLKPALSEIRLPFDIVCTHRLSKRLHPEVPSRNIRGLSGFFGVHFDEIKRARDHVLATFEIWRGLAAELTSLGIENISDLNSWLEMSPKPKPKTQRYEYRVAKEKRLALPDRPGVYRMYSKAGKILYVGKATSLKERVNSYFRGKRGREPRKLELMAQVWDLDFTECASTLEAALLEADEIKKHDPPYNVSLKTGRRGLLFYSRDFEKSRDKQDLEHPLGPFRPLNSIERLRRLARSLEGNEFQQVFHQPVPEEDLKAGFDLFCLQREIDVHSLTCLRDHIALGLRLLRSRITEDEADLVPNEASTSENIPSQSNAPSGPNEEYEAHEEYEEMSDTATPLGPSIDMSRVLNVVLSLEEIAEKFERLYLRSAEDFLRSRILTKLLNSRVLWMQKGTWKTLSIRRGHITQVTSEAAPSSELQMPSPALPWTDLDIADYDRMSVLLSELSKYPHEIQITS